MSGSEEKYVRWQLSRCLGKDWKEAKLFPTGHNDDSHLLCVLQLHSRTERVFLKRGKGTSLEGEVVRQLSKKHCDTPQILGEFCSLEEAGDWLIFTWQEGKWLDCNRYLDLEVGVRALARMHANTRFLRCDVLPTWTPTFMKASDCQWLELSNGEYEWVQRCCEIVTRSPTAWIRQDNHPSNFLLAGEAVTLVDWERACMGPVTVDLGNYLTFCKKEWRAKVALTYSESFQSLGLEMPCEQIQEWARAGLCYELQSWLVQRKNAILSRQDDSRNYWYLRHVEPRIRDLRELVNAG